MTSALNVKRPGLDRSGAITAGATAQVLAAANPQRNGLYIQNIDAAEDLWVNEFGTAALTTAGSVLIPAKTSFLVNTANAISVVATTTGHKYTATEW